MSELHM